MCVGVLVSFTRRVGNGKILFLVWSGFVFNSSCIIGNDTEGRNWLGGSIKTKKYEFVK